MVKGSHHVSLFTVSRQDLHDYERCPKILAIKTYLMLKQPIEEPEPVEAPAVEGLAQRIIKKVGEVATQVAFTKPVPPEVKQVTALREIQRLGMTVDEELKNLLAESLAGSIRSGLH